MKYRILNHTSSPFLNDNIVKVYELTASGKENCYKTIPNGQIGISISVTGSSCYFENEKWVKIPKSVVYGLIKKPSLIKDSIDLKEISFGFNPLYLSRFLKCPMYLIADRFTDLNDIFDTCDVADLEESLGNSKNDNDVINAIERFLKKSFKPALDAQLLDVYKKIALSPTMKVDDLANNLNVSTRTLLNKFKSNIGLSPKDLMKIYRINSSLNINFHNPNNLTDLAYKLGYFDQSHFIHDFKETLGMNPEKYFKNNSLISDFYNLDRWNLA